MIRVVLFLIIFVSCNTIYAQKYDFIICNFFSGNSSNKIVSVKLQSGISVSFDSSRPIILPFDKNNSSNIVFTFTKGDGTQGYGTLYTYTISEAVYSERVVFYTDYSHNPSYPQDFGVVYNHYTKDLKFIEGSYLCEGDILSFPCPDYAGTPIAPYIVKLRDEKSDWKVFSTDYNGQGISYDDLNNFCIKEFGGKSIIDCTCFLMITFAGFDYYYGTIPPYRYKIKFKKDQLLLTTDINGASTVKISPANDQDDLKDLNISFTHSVLNVAYPSSSSPSLKEGISKIVIGRAKGCPMTYYANVFKIKHNYVYEDEKNKYDFWSKSQERDDAIELHGFYITKDENISKPIPIINGEPLDGVDSKEQEKICVLKDVSSEEDCESSYSYYKYYLKGLKEEEEKKVTITYGDDSPFISQTITFTLQSAPKITVQKGGITRSNPECSDGFGTLKLSEIHGGLNNGYYYTIIRNNETISTTAISSADGTMSVKNGDIIRIYDNDHFDGDIEEYHDSRKWEYTVSGLSAIQPSFSYPRANIKCFGGTTEQVVEISNYSKNINYSWTVKINNSSKNTTSGIANGSTIVINNLPADEHSITWHITKNGDKCWNDNSTSFTITQPTEDISFDFSTTSTTCKNSNDGEIIISNLKGGNGGAYTFWMGENEQLTEDNSKLKISKNENDEVDYILTNNFYSSNKEDGEQTDYVVTVKDRKGCSKSSENISIDYENPQQTLQLIPTATSCEAAENGTLSYDTIGRFKPTKVDYISTLETSPTINDELKLINYQFGVGTYNIGLIDGKGCRFDSSFTIVSNTYTFSSSTENASCAAAPNGSAEISATISTTKGNKQGSFNPTCYSWTLQNNHITKHTTTTDTISGLLPGKYNVKINHDVNCTSSTEVVIGTNTYNFQGTQYHDLSCVDASNGYITAQINKSGNGDFNIKGYKWHVKPHGSFNNSSQDKNIFYLSGINEGEYTLEINHDNYCTESTTVNISVNDYEWTTNHLNLSCKEVSNGYISATINRKDDFNGVFKINKYSWTVADTTYKSGENPANEKDGTYSFELTDLAPGLYRLSLTHDEKCTESTTVKIDVNDYYHDVTTTNAPCADIPSATATAVTNILSGTPESFHPHYIWTIKNGEPVPTGSDNFITERYSGDYNVRLEWEGGCYTEINFDIKHDTLRPSFLTTHAECADKQSIGGKVEINMSPERTYRYIWDDDTEGTEYNIAENLAAGSHTVKIFDQHNCSIIESFNILNNDFSVNVKSENALCRQDATGKVTFDIKGGRGKYAIDWQGNNALSQSNITTKSFTQDNVPVGVYTINVKDETNCVSTHKVTIASGNLKVSHKETEASCSSIGNARAEIAVSGAKLPVTYKWSDNVETPDPVRNNLTNGNYVVTVVDQNNCSMPVDIKIYSKKLSTATAIDSATCGLDPDGAAEIRLFSATSPFTFTWPDGKITSESKRSGLDKGNYDVLITDANGCEVHANVAIPHKGYLQNDVPSSINLCYNGEITVDANEFDGYEWICNGWVVDNNRFLTVKSPGTYIVKANGYDDCYAVDTISVTMSPTSFSPYFRMSSVSYINDTLVVMEMSQTNPDKYSWKYDTLAFDCDNSKGSERELRLIPKLSGIYSVTLSAENQDCVSDISKPVEIFATVRPDDEFSPLYVDNSIVKAFNLSPNPTKGPITVEVNLSQISDVRLTIYDLNFGKIRKQVTLRNSDNYKLDINDVISTGAYVVILQTGNETKQIKYIVSR